MSIHHESIYRYIYWDNGKGLQLWQYLTHARYKRMKKGGRKVGRSKTIPNGISIDARPEDVQKRDIVGHWETDNVVGRVTDTAVLSTTVERVSRYTILTKLYNKTAKEKSNSVINRLLYFPQHMKKSITTDNGVENANHKQVSAKLKMPMYFCHPYSSWEKGTVENMNGRIRRYIPKGYSIDSIAVQDIVAIEHKLNNTLRKCLGYKTPQEVVDEVWWQHTAYGSLRPEVRAYLASG